MTLSGQIVSEGCVPALPATRPPCATDDVSRPPHSFINWRTKPWKRRLITRCIGIVPSLAVALSVGRQGIDTLLVASQVALSIVLTFVLMPCVVS